MQHAQDASPLFIGVTKAIGALLTIRVLLKMTVGQIQPRSDAIQVMILAYMIWLGTSGNGQQAAGVRTTKRQRSLLKTAPAELDVAVAGTTAHRAYDQHTVAQAVKLSAVTYMGSGLPTITD